MQSPHALTDHTLVDITSAAGASRCQRLTAGGLTVILYVALWGAWMLVIGVRPCVTASLLWH
jgi:hypothetical protein